MLGRGAEKLEMCEQEGVTIRLRIEGVWMTIVQYAPMNDKDEETKDVFYGELQGLIGKVPKGDKLIVMGDCNAGVGNKGEIWRE